MIIEVIILLFYILIAIGCGLSIRFTLSYCDQNWVSSYHHTISYALLPAITFIITKVISGNIALSLGMVGALSIVRFRNPVRNPLELVMYFALITIGIASSINTNYGVLLTIIIICVLLIFKYILYNKAFKINTLSFGDGNLLNTAEISLKSQYDELKKNEFIIESIENFEEKIYTYRFASSTKQDLNELTDKIKKDYKDISSITCNYIN